MSKRALWLALLSIPWWASAAHADSAATTTAGNVTAAAGATAASATATSRTTGAIESARYVAKKDRELADKRARTAPRTPVTRVGQKPAPLVNLQHRWTNEWLAVPLTGPPPDAALAARLLRDHYTNEPTDMAAKLLPTVLAAARHFKVARVEIVSAYRHPKYNLILRKKGHEVARDSEHTHGKAVDFRLPGVEARTLARWALTRRLGGVGTYVSSNFVHIDVGAVRTWSGE